MGLFILNWHMPCKRCNQRRCRMQPDLLTRPVVAVVNTSQEATDLLYTTLTNAGFTVVTAFTTEFKSGTRDFKMFVEIYRPRAIVYDIAIPYVMNWRFFEQSIR